MTIDELAEKLDGAVSELHSRFDVGERKFDAALEALRASKASVVGGVLIGLALLAAGYLLGSL